MSKRGRKRKPGALAEAQGFPGQGRQRRRAENEPKPEPLQAGSPPPPFLTRLGKRTWEALGSRLARLGLLTEIDQMAFGRYCDILENWVKVKELLEKEGISYRRISKSLESDTTLTEEQKIAASPSIIRQEFYAYLQLSKELGRIEREFGLTPSSRASLAVPKDNEDPNAELEKETFG